MCSDAFQATLAKYLFKIFICTLPHIYLYIACNECRIVVPASHQWDISIFIDFTRNFFIDLPHTLDLHSEKFILILQ